AAAHLPPESVRVLTVEIAGAHPAINKRLLRDFRPLPITLCRARAANPKISFRALGDWMVVMIDQLCFVSSQQFAAASVSDIAFVIRHEHVEHLSRADAVQNFHAESFLPLFAK